MSKKLLVFAMFFAVAFGTAAFSDESKEIETIEEKLAIKKVMAEENEKKNGVRANFKKIELDYSKTSVKNANEYLDSPYAFLNSNDESTVDTIIDFALETEGSRYRWDNKVFAAYGKTSIKDNVSGTTTSSENTDQITVSSDYIVKLWTIKQADLGPFASVGYQTEFTTDDDTPRNKIVRSRLGLKLFNGKYFSDLYIANIVELELTYDKNVTKYGLEISADAKFELRDGVQFKTDGYFRQYLAFSSYNPNDLEYDLNFFLRMNVNITKVLSVSPFISFRQAKSRGAENLGRNTNIGISFVYSDVFRLK